MNFKKYTALYVSPSSRERQTISKSLGLAGRDLQFECLDLGHAINRLRKEDHGLDVVVAYVSGWHNQQESFEKMVGVAKEKKIRVIYAIGERASDHINLNDERCRDYIIYKGASDLYRKVKEKLEESDASKEDAEAKKTSTSELRQIDRNIAARRRGR